MTLTEIECCSCHVIFGMSQEWIDALRNFHNTFYCPAGHAMSFTGQNEKERLQLALSQQKNITNSKDRAIDELNRQIRRLKRKPKQSPSRMTRIKPRKE